jgi:multidrug efflux system outer membrane protein
MQFRFISFIFIAVFLQACVLYPPYQRPVVEVPETWRIPVDEASSYANYQWWQQFNDPVLDDLVLEALQNNNDLKVAIARVWEFLGDLDIARSGLYPQIYGTLEYTRQEVSIAGTPFPLGYPRTANDYIAGFNATFEIDVWGKIRSASEAALANLLAQIEARRTVVLTLVSSVASSYIQLRLFDKQLDIARKTYESRIESYELALVRYLGGLTSELPVKQAESEMEDALGQVLNLEVSVAQEENLLSVLVGHPPRAMQRGLWLDDLHLPPDVPAGIPSEVLEQRPDILQVEDLLIAANANIGVARANFFPSISLTGAYGNESFQLHNLFTAPALAWQYTLAAVQPLFTGGLLLGQLEVAKAQQCEAYYAYCQTVLVAFQEVDDALIAHEKSKEQFKVQSRRVLAVTDALHLARVQYENGQVDYLNVLDAQRNLFAAQLYQAQAMGETFLTLVNLFKSLGGGWVIQADEWALEDE